MVGNLIAVRTDAFLLGFLAFSVGQIMHVQIIFNNLEPRNVNQLYEDIQSMSNN